jgi:hypothetical protein
LNSPLDFRLRGNDSSCLHGRAGEMVMIAAVLAGVGVDLRRDF